MIARACAWSVALAMVVAHVSTVQIARADAGVDGGAAYLAPPMEDRVTDPARKIGTEARRELGKMLEEVRRTTQVDVVAFVAPVGGDDLEKAGRAAYEGWQVGAGYDSGILLVLSDDGEASAVIVPDKEPALHRDEAVALEATMLKLSRQGQLAIAFRVAAKKIEEIHDARPVALRVLPRGTPDLGKAARYGTGVLFVVMAAGFLARRRRRLEPP